MEPILLIYYQTAQSSAERTARDAPMSLIQEIRENITLHRQPRQIQDLLEDVIVNGIVSENTAFSLLKGFSKLSSRWLFLNTDLTDLRTKSPLLFGTCILAGLHITPSLHGSPTHHALYRHVHGLLGRSQCASAVSLDTIQAMLVCSMWDLRPTRDHDHGNSWLLSGTAAMQVMITTSFGQLLQTRNIQEQARAREILRTWNLICLCQLQFSVGSGRPPVISGQYFDQCAKILEFPSYNSRDELVLAGVYLYRKLWELVSSNVIQKEVPAWPEIEQLCKSQEHIYNLDSSEPLRFAYSCTYLILARRTLQHIHESQPGNSSSTRIRPEADNALAFIRFAIHHSNQILVLFLSMSDLTTCIHPAYENLLCSFAMVTLAEFVSHVVNIGETIGLMERAISHIQRGGKAEPVSRWSLNVIKQHVNGSELDSFIDGADSTETFAPPTAENPRSWMESDWSMNLEQEFPSLEDMFFGNAA
ncbi:uncharacterized protein N7498_001584 [Penicillium cinerascens]|uniref:Transcription factor domain-containing protein n=1 Tax=Penicillium cinerascens TaxID=70096 RepID=A0A9W9TFC2_9EURO|nr:uncharacterized protein N7498_001584 [Penicillium cinerascens]KAJ5219485.1 hypothetical protein N7498_001584 [Penicillium cinerascens]